MRAVAELDVEPGQRIRWRAEPPVVLRRTGPSRVHLVQAAGGPLGGDDLALNLRLAAGTRLEVASAAATVVQPGSGPVRWTVTAELAPGARLRWWPEPTVVCDGAELHASVRLRVAGGAGALVREEVRLGRHGQRGGRYRGTLTADHAGEPLVRHSTVLDGADPGLCGPAGTAGGRTVASVLGAGTEPAPGIDPVGERDGLRWARHELAGDGWLLLAVGCRSVCHESETGRDMHR
ncbi:urease accessory protein UreD [Pseudonocardia acaciae]|uniref:urease accessory protein UreD n=1 Tax=Pseudonocardia acaciae TaxID=551276 RepID=UPI000686233C|nr:urease accessory protein UreD [Pseudonocardia acaciae]